MGYETILVSDAGMVRTITLNRPERRNALTPLMQTELTEAFKAAGSDDACAVVVLTGAGITFCAGLDLTVLQEMKGRSSAQMEEDARRVAGMFAALYEIEKPTIAAVQGAAVAGGTGLATICDFTIAAPDAKFAYTEVKIGFVPALVSVYLMLNVGEKRARDLLLTARVFTAEDALQYGLVTEIVPAEGLMARVDAVVKMLLANSPASLRATKKLLLEQRRGWMEAGIAGALAANAASRETADFTEGVAAFLEKRKADWKR